MNKNNHRVSGKSHNFQQLNHYANQKNPNNESHRANLNNHANQLNPNNGEYYNCRNCNK